MLEGDWKVESTEGTGRSGSGRDTSRAGEIGKRGGRERQAWLGRRGKNGQPTPGAAEGKQPARRPPPTSRRAERTYSG